MWSSRAAPLLCEVADHPIQYGICHRILGGQRDFGGVSAGTEDDHCVGVVVEPHARSTDIVNDQEIDSLALELSPASFEHIVRLGGEPDQNLIPGPPRD